MMLGSAVSSAAVLGAGLARTLATSSAVAAAAAAPAVVSKSSSGGFASLLGFGSSRIDVPLSEPLPSLAQPLKGTVPTVAPVLATSSLDAGTKVAAIDVPSPVAAVALAYEAGPAVETADTLGLSRVVAALAFKATSHRTTFRLTRELEKIGAVATASAGRDHLAFAISGVRLHAPELVEVLLDSTLNARLNYWEVTEGVAAAKATLAAELRDPTSIITDALHRAAFDGGLGQPLHVDPSLLDGVTNAAVKEYLASVLHPSKAVVAAAGVGLDEFKALANPLVGGGGAAPSASAVSSTYLGGSLAVLAPTSPLSYVALAFEVKGGLSAPKAAAAAAVVKALLDEGRTVLPRLSKDTGVLTSVKGLSALYKTTGLVGVLASSAPASAPAAVDAVTSKVAALTKPVPDATLKAAKQVAVGAFKAALSTSAGLAGAIAPALLLAGKFSTTEFVSAVEGLTAADVAGFVTAGLKAKPTLVTYGSHSTRLPQPDEVLKRLT